jgi:CRP/FNR family cyclic AMP-dependent transcriptional regulator
MLLKSLGMTPHQEGALNTAITLVRKNCNLDPKKFLSTIGKGRKVATFVKQETIFTQGDTAGPVFYIQDGNVKYTVVSTFGKEATLGILSEGAFLGDGVLAGQSLHAGTATAKTDCKLLQIEKEAMMLALRREPGLSDMFVAYLLARNIRYQQDLVDQFFNSGEKRLAQVLLLQARFGQEGAPETVMPNVSHNALASMAGTTQCGVVFFMERFKRLGFLAYSKRGLRIHSSLLNLVLRD